MDNKWWESNAPNVRSQWGTKWSTNQAMTDFKRLEQLFVCDWATVYVGWQGTGVYSPWPEDWEKFPPLLTVDELYEFCERAVGWVEDESQVRIAELMEELCLAKCSRVSILTSLANLARSCDGIVTDLELRKWRCARLMNIITGSHASDVFTCAREIDETLVEFGSLGGAFENIRCGVWSDDASVRYDEKQCLARVMNCRELLDAEIALVRKLQEVS